MDLTVQNVYGLLLRSKLLPLEEAKGMYARWQAEAGESTGNVARFASWMVSNRYLTTYQAALLARGHADNFFLGEYKILDRRGKGRMAGVYKAQHQLGQVVAIKVLPPSRARDAGALGRFKREAKLAMRLKHPNIVRAFQVGRRGNAYYLVMEYLEGETLEEVLDRRKQLPPAEAVRLIYQALQGLQHIHQLGLVHRDLKPANLMLTAEAGATIESTFKTTLKILDMGLGRALFDEANVERLGGAELTAEGVLLGTPDYMAPEQARDSHAVDIRSDIYSLGCVLYHLIAGQAPFPDSNIISQMIRHASEIPRPLVEFNPAVPEGLQQIVNWMMAKDPAQRYPTPERAAQALQVFLSAGTESSAAPEDARLSKYLVWLDEKTSKATSPNPALTPAATPAAASASPAVVVKEKSAPAKGTRTARKHASRNRGVPPRLLSAEVSPAAPDVELVAVVPTQPAWQLPFGWHLSRREAIAFGIGVAAGGCATLLVSLVAFGRRDPMPAAKEPVTPESRDTGKSDP